MKDNVTGLIWEGKTPTGVRSGDKTYTNYADNTSGDASAYVNMVNGLNLCGFSDWRLPSVQELRDIEHFGAAVGEPRVVAEWFPNTLNANYWTSDQRLSPSSNRAWRVSFQTYGSSSVFAEDRENTFAVRLVRGAVWTGQRFMITSLYYPGDGINNAAIDRQTGLIWRRCQVGETWTGSTCTGTATLYSHFLALVQASNTASWRLPNAKELGRLIDYRSTSSPALDRTAFPITNRDYHWTSTPSHATGKAAMVQFLFGFSFDVDRVDSHSMMLVQSQP